MSLFITSLNSGSNGNCYYIGNEHEAILVDAGISCRETEKRMNRLGLSIKKIKAIFISHEHSDHISGIPVLAKKYGIPVYITPQTLKHLHVNLDEYQFLHFTGYQPISIGNLSITAFPKLHDASDPYSFIISCRDITVGVFTDIGAACDHLIANFNKCHAAFLEANYDEEMLQNSNYPFYLKQRISGGNGHLSNKQALELFITHRSPSLSHLLLSHLSKNNNRPELVYELFNTHAKDTEIIVASRFEETPVYLIGGTNEVSTVIGQLEFKL
jgi:phosphoribosyl 1,2-cyclic phosphodiesterase